MTTIEMSDVAWDASGFTAKAAIISDGSFYWMKDFESGLTIGPYEVPPYSDVDPEDDDEEEIEAAYQELLRSKRELP